MEGFNAAVGVPPERAGESVFTFDGDNLGPNGTPEVRHGQVRFGGLQTFPLGTLVLAYAHGVYAVTRLCWWRGGLTKLEKFVPKTTSFPARHGRSLACK